MTPHGQNSRLQFDDTIFKSEFLQFVDFTSRVQSEFNDIRLYNTQGRGRMLVVNNIVRYSEKIVGNSPLSRPALTHPRFQDL